MPWNLVQEATVVRGEVFFMTTNVAASKSYILRCATVNPGAKTLWGVWKFGFYVNIGGSAGLTWTERSSRLLYSRQENYFTQAQNDVQAFAFFLPSRSPYRSLGWTLYRFD